MVFTAHIPHNSDQHHEKLDFGYWKDDGFQINKDKDSRKKKVTRKISGAGAIKLF